MARETTTWRTAFVMALAVAMALGLVQPASALLVWNQEVVDYPGFFGGRSAIALDSSGRPHIAYYDDSSDQLKYARKLPSGAWSIETVDSSGHVLSGHSIAVDSNGRAHISYYFHYLPDAAGDLRHAKRVCTSAPCEWVIETVRAGVHSRWMAGNTSLALDGGGNPHIGSFDHVRGRLTWSRWGGSAWSITDVVASPGGTTSLAIDGSGFPHFGYTEGGTGLLKYAKLTCVVFICGWTVEGLYPGIIGNLKLDAAGHVHLTYSVTGVAVYALRSCTTACSWNYQVVASVGNVIARPSLALDSNGAARLAFVRNSAGSPIPELHYAWKGRTGSWVTEVVDFDVQPSSSVSLALDASNDPHVSYETASALQYARGAPLQITPMPMIIQ